MSSNDSNLINLLRSQAKLRLEILLFITRVHISEEFIEEQNDDIISIILQGYVIENQIEKMQLTAENEETVTYQNVDKELLDLALLIADLTLRFQRFHFARTLRGFKTQRNFKNDGNDGNDASAAT